MIAAWPDWPLAGAAIGLLREGIFGGRDIKFFKLKDIRTS